MDIWSNFFYTPSGMKSIEMVCKFAIPGGREVIYRLLRAAQTISPVAENSVTPPAWAESDNCRCTTGPLTAGKHPYGPIAVNISRLVAFFKPDSPAYRFEGMK